MCFVLPVNGSDEEATVSGQKRTLPLFKSVSITASVLLFALVLWDVAQSAVSFWNQQPCIKVW